MNAIAFFDKKMYPIYGSVKFHQCDEKSMTKISIELEGFTDTKEHGIHIHTYGDLSRGCSSACDHFNPNGKLHGSQRLYGLDRHVGDMINNIRADRTGKVKVEYTDPLINLFGYDTVIGRMVVIHADRDNEGIDRETDKESATTGKAGARIACAVIGLAKNGSC